MEKDRDYAGLILGEVFRQLPEGCRYLDQNFESIADWTELTPFIKNDLFDVEIDLTEEAKKILADGLSKNPWRYKEFRVFDIVQGEKTLLQGRGYDEPGIIDILSIFDIPEVWIEKANTADCQIEIVNAFNNEDIRNDELPVDYRGLIFRELLLRLPEGCVLTDKDFTSFDLYPGIEPYQMLDKDRGIMINLSHSVIRRLYRDAGAVKPYHIPFKNFVITKNEKVLAYREGYEVNINLEEFAIPQDWREYADNHGFKVMFHKPVKQLVKLSTTEEDYTGKILCSVLSQLPSDCKLVAPDLFNIGFYPELTYHEEDEVSDRGQQNVIIELTPEAIKVLIERIETFPYKYLEFDRFDIMKGDERLLHAKRIYNGIEYYVSPKFDLPDNWIENVKRNEVYVIVTDNIPHPWFYKDDEYPGLLLYNIISTMKKSFQEDCKLAVHGFMNMKHYAQSCIHHPEVKERLVIDLYSGGGTAFLEMLRANPDMYWDFDSFCLMSGDTVYLKGVDRKILRVLSIFLISKEYMRRCTNAGIEIIFNSSIIPLR
jgi:hypothetical protein